jgi:hypothetical protein
MTTTLPVADSGMPFTYAISHLCSLGKMVQQAWLSEDLEVAS